MKVTLIEKKVITIIICLFIVGLTVSFSYASTFNEAMDNLASQITSEISGNEKKHVAVVDFTDLDGEVSDLGKFVAEEILIRLFRAGEVQVVERRFIKKMMEEMKLQKSGVIDEGSIRKLGRLLGVDALCTGTITELLRTVKINARLIDTETGSIFAASSCEIDKTDLPYVGGDQSGKAQARLRQNYKRKFNYLQNGGFQHRYNHWTRSIGDINRGFSKAEIVPFSHAKSGKALHITHKGECHIQFSQVVPVPGPDFIFGGSFQASSHEGMIKSFSGSGAAQIGLQYFDAQSNKLGETILINYVKNLFADTPLIGVPRRSPDTYKTHYIEYSGDKFNHNYEIEIRREIENNLMGIDPEAVRFIAVILWCGATHAQAGSELWVTDLFLKSK